MLGLVSIVPESAPRPRPPRKKAAPVADPRASERGKEKEKETPRSLGFCCQYARALTSVHDSKVRYLLEDLDEDVSADGCLLDAPPSAGGEYHAVLLCYGTDLLGVAFFRAREVALLAVSPSTPRRSVRCSSSSWP
jgi:hypothetical protein